MGQVIQLNRKKKPKEKPNIGVIVQARMTSKRFPGKSMALLLGVPVLKRVLDRVSSIPEVKVVLAVPDSDASEPMLELTDFMKIESFLGSELNVLKRYYDCAKLFRFQYVVRVTADCPFIDPRVCKECIDLLLFRKLDYCSNVFPNRSFPAGLDCEVFTFDALEAAHMMAENPYDLEHVTPWMQRTEGIRRACVEQRIDMSKENWCIDYPTDIERLEKLAQGRGAKELVI